jgi:uncharacterized protein (TIRG00374 family)
VLFGLAIGGLLLRVLMWYAFLNHETPTRFKTAAEIDLIINFLNQLLPSRLSGRVAAPLVLIQRANIDMGDGIGITGVNTGVYGVTYGVVSLCGIALSLSHLSSGILTLVSISTVLYLSVGLIILVSGLNAATFDMWTERFVSFVEQIPAIGNLLNKGLKYIPEFSEQSERIFHDILRSPSTIGLYLIGWLGSIAVFPALRVALLFDTFGFFFTPLITLPAVLVAAYSVTLLPLTPGGIGVTEATAAAVFVSLGVPYEIAAASVLVDRVFGVYLPALLGWYPLVRGNPLTLKAE